jgi:HTH-type transcriptional regulator, transcriptional repressor of NAD biosynthesis genes
MTTSGLIVGRFDPPHLGHSFLIDSAAAQCDRLVVYVNSRSTDAAPGRLRAAWLAELHPDVRVIEVLHDLDTDWNDEGLWAKWIELFRSHWPVESGPDIVFSSEGYSAELATRLSATPIIVDQERRNVPISATMIRGDPASHLDHLAAPVRAWVEANWL